MCFHFLNDNDNKKYLNDPDEKFAYPHIFPSNNLKSFVLVVDEALYFLRW